MSVPTWNYVAVHVYGTIELVNHADELLQALQALTEKYEPPGNSYTIDSSNIEVIEGLMKGIVGFRVKIQQLEGKWKLSQNHSEERRKKVILELENKNSDHASQIANLMKNMLN